MGITINFIIFILIITYIVWTWRSTKEFGDIFTRILYIAIGTAVIVLVTFILFLFSKIGIEYPKQEMIPQVRKIILTIFTPINGFVMLPQIANIIVKIKKEDISKEEFQKSIKKLLIIGIIIIVIECMYFNKIQTGIINYINIIR